MIFLPTVFRLVHLTAFNDLRSAFDVQSWYIMAKGAAKFYLLYLG